MLATVKIVRKSAGAPVVYDQATRTYTADTFIVYEGKARVQPYGSPQDTVVGQDTTARGMIRVQIEEKNIGAEVDDVVFITASPEAADLTNYTLEVRGSVPSSNAWITDLMCEVDTKRV